MTRELSRPTVYANTQAFPTNGANCKDTIWLGLSHQTVGFSWYSCMVKSFSP